ncbi:hypothetical protein [Rhizobium ruizarguesonis]|uniref:hypothetical protein n=1 Tax=Rhizobium ruizarguesonis TaxID=2081791 RepID=UPI00102F85B1|nr:hypothetical protein [Rhizobium ruizarguesonis]TBE02317.1 hypothetical protein ELH10_15600 [Rhizobium ruizarguesonis]TBF14694.1 hypothetical protein ELG95_14750 [Rhizobium ruizarguesonis]
MISIESIQSKASKMLVAGWFAGLIYYGWRAKDTAAALPIWEYAVVAIVGMFIVSIIIGTILTALAAGVTRVATGQAGGSPHAYAWAAFAAPILAFFTAGYVVAFLG